MIIFTSDHPEAIIEQQQQRLLAGSETSLMFAVQFEFDQYYLAPASRVGLMAIVHLLKDMRGVGISAAVFRHDPTLHNAIGCLQNDLVVVQDFVWALRRPWLNLSAPLMLDPVKVAKPWGQEIWYTGIEARAQANVIAQGFTVPLPWVLALMPIYLAAGLDKKIILLKTLDPLIDEVYGNLYFELHEVKQEVYIVTHIDSEAWPDGVGAIRLGFAAEKYLQYGDDEAFKAAYLQVVERYEEIRRAIDLVLDDMRREAGIGLDVPIVSDRLRLWNQCLPESLLRQERQARELMDSFVAEHPLRLGDVVKVPCFVPHSLQHGVRTLEFQTPVYERKILSFAQKVLTQDRWDTRAALEKIHLQAPAQAPLAIVFQRAGVLVEEVVSFADFGVVRIHLEAFQRYRLAIENSYALLLSIGNPCLIECNGYEVNVAAEVATFIPQAVLADSRDTVWLKASAAPVQIVVATVLIEGADTYY